MEEDKSVKEGIVVFMQTDKGSKSQSVQPYLYQGNGEMVRLWKQGDNPFEQNALKPYDGKRVCVTGSTDENDILCVSEIEEKD